jgi:hypothetical protein
MPVMGEGQVKSLGAVCAPPYKPPLPHPIPPGEGSSSQLSLGPAPQGVGRRGAGSRRSLILPVPVPLGFLPVLRLLPLAQVVIEALFKVRGQQSQGLAGDMNQVGGGAGGS